MTPMTLKFLPVALACGLSLAPGMARAQTPATSIAPTSVTDAEFKAWGRKFEDAARSMAAPGWEVRSVSWPPQKNYVLGLPPGPQLTIGFVTIEPLARPAWAGKKAGVTLTIIPRQKRRFVPPPLPPRLDTTPIAISRQIASSYFMGSSEEATFYYEAFAPAEVQSDFLNRVRRTFGISEKFSSVDDLLYELTSGAPGELLYHQIALRPEAERLQIARVLLARMRLTDPVFNISDVQLARVMNQNLGTPANGQLFVLGNGTDRNALRERRIKETCDIWDKWIRWAESKTEDQWMQRALAENIESVRSGRDPLADERIMEFIARNAGRNFSVARFDRDHLDLKSLVAWYDANKDRLAWDNKKQQFFLR